MSALDVASTIISGVSALANPVMTYFTNKSNESNVEATNASQQKMFNSQMDYTKAVQQQQWERDDNTLQRGVADAQKAGLSPLAALGVNNTGSAVSQPSAPSLQTARAIAPQFDMSQVAGELMQMGQRQYQSNEAQKQRNFLDAQLVNQIDGNLKLEQTRIAGSKDIADKDRLQNALQFDKSLSEQVRTTDANLFLSNQKLMSENLRAQFGGNTPKLKPISDAMEFESEYTNWLNRYNDYVESYLGSDYGKSLQSSASHSAQGGGSVGAFGLNAGASGGSSDSSSADN